VAERLLTAQPSVTVAVTDKICRASSAPAGAPLAARIKDMIHLLMARTNAHPDLPR
jgi:hypothetical protein